jgi:hypothetical protein
VGRLRFRARDGTERNDARAREMRTVVEQRLGGRYIPGQAIGIDGHTEGLY